MIHVNFTSAAVDPVYFPQVEVIGDIANSVPTDVLSVPLGRYPEQANATSDCNARGGPAADQEKHPLSKVNHQIDAVSGALRDYLVNRRELPPALLDEMIMLGRERALTGAIDNDIPSQDLERLATDLIAEDRLTPEKTPHHRDGSVEQRQRQRH